MTGTGGRVATRAITWTVIAGAVAAVTVAVLVPRLGGATPYTVLTESMRPELPPGTLVVTRPVRARDVRIGDVITFQRVSGEPEVVTHRVDAISLGADGQPRWRTRGDANPVPDVAWVRPVQLKGRLWYAVPLLGRVNLWLDGHQRRTATVLVALGLAGYAAVMWASAGRDRIRRGATA
ncbi:signal peptidase I [Nocardioides marmoriginsengisoli]|uniref:Signal peptidase I n=1 Tax=Nocardioides marmoriginsengisoli TaxID=661483 RepID=A0A3N0CI12_9ACTN|nr:signal peptidase I [Nocardioides marmoriginsengisoli]RNL62959.1 signal peptidase I [Nocardioides marmoriginsengisoli]